MLSGLGFGFFQTPNNRNMLLSPRRRGRARPAALQATARLFGQTNGAVITALLFGLVGAAAPRVALGVGAGFALAAGARQHAAPGPRRRPERRSGAV